MARAGLSFPGGGPVPLTLHGITYWARLQPLDNVKGDIVVVDLIVTRGRVDHGHNLLEPKGHWHGIQPFDFGGRDLAHGIDPSVYGADRVFRIGGDRLRVHVRSAIVDQGKSDPALKRLDLELAIDSVGSGARR